MMRILVTGKQGQVVQALMQRGAETGIEVLTIGRPEMDMADPAQTFDAIKAAIVAHQPMLIVNAAAYTAVDQAEDEPDLAHSINAASAAAVAQAAADAGLPIIQISTDYVFDGLKDGPYVETDAPNPQGVYGASKLAGENAVRAANPHHLILRTAWVYSPFGKNFVKTMLRLAETRDELSVVADQFGNPTSAFEIADGVLAAARQIKADASTTPWGTYHLAGTGATHWAGFAEAIFKLSAEQGGPTATVKPITTAQYPTKAKRPANSQLDCRAFEAAFGWRAANWQESLKGTIDILLPKQIEVVTVEPEVLVTREESTPANSQKRTCILVLGMHRSGTSAVTGTLVKLGVAGPNTPIVGQYDNPKGHWESLPITLFHDELLASAGSYWQDWRPFNSEWYNTPEALQFKNRAKQLLAAEFADSSMFALKDPRICRFARFWLEVFADEGILTHVVMPFRNPLEVAQSLKTRNGMPMAQGLLLWMSHVIEAEAATRQVPRAIIEWWPFLEDWRSETKNIATALDIRWPNLTDEAVLDIDDFLTADLKHENASDDQVRSHLDIHPWIVTIFDALQELRINQSSADALSQLGDIRTRYIEAAALFGSSLKASEAKALTLADDKELLLADLESLVTRYIKPVI